MSIYQKVKPPLRHQNRIAHHISATHAGKRPENDQSGSKAIVISARFDYCCRPKSAITARPD
ncbi:hypothetical protein A1342_02390 [Methylomonas methanica]|uniref:Uncharacterized protein n=1 Tax=Methylomonas denitrificans TaxID=1538553 RepID=A0A126T1D8_9GAMM|nr:hypothetical protein [Methylomonas methanica]AMK75900.1 hypothetical protein JT25_005255 [Methylomonas denitrificans]OAI01289.1 hypothetical protein A1342_02390 [Methylomonas methanica]